MKRIYTAIDLGSDSIKVLVSELVSKKFHVLASTTVRSVGIQKGKIIDYKLASSSLKLALHEIENLIGVKITRVLLAIPGDNASFDITSSEISINNEEKIVTGEEIVTLLGCAVNGKVPEGNELISITPIEFVVDDTKKVKDPKGMAGDTLAVKAVIASVPKNDFNDYLKAFHETNVEITDVCLSGVANYYEARNADMDNTVGAIIDIGSDRTSISIFNKGIMIKSKVIDLGSKLLDQDISYIYKVDRTMARNLKENFAVSNIRYADINEILELENTDGQSIVVNQQEVSGIVESRIREILKKAKNEINVLTKHEISYIIITGGVTELVGFQYIVDNAIGRNALTLNITTIGIRNNKYSIVAGLIKFFYKKLELRGKNYSMFSSKEEEELIAIKKKMTNLSNENIISKVFGYFFDR